MAERDEMLFLEQLFENKQKNDTGNSTPPSFEDFCKVYVQLIDWEEKLFEDRISTTSEQRAETAYGLIREGVTDIDTGPYGTLQKHLLLADERRTLNPAF